MMRQSFLRKYPRKYLFLGHFLGATLLVASLQGCGSSGGMQTTGGGSGSADAQKGNESDAVRDALLAKFQTPEFIDCRDRGFFYDRRNEKCLTDLKTKNIPCTREGISKAFNESGSQIIQILDRSLGNLTIPGDKGEGYIIDQCGGSASGHYRVDLLKEGPDGKFQIREIESK